jgi:sulfotransferase
MLAALLNQNPRFHASGTSAAQIIFSQLYNQFSGASEMAALMDDDQRRAVLHAIVDAIHHKRGDKPVVFDTNRKWLQRAEQLAELFPLCRFVVCVRDPAYVVSSLEKARRALTFRQSKMFDPDATLAQRVRRLTADDGIVGSCMAMIGDALTGPMADRMIVVDYDRILNEPAKTMGLIYQFLREPAFDHDFENFSFDLPELDAFLNMPGLHRISGPLRPASHEMLLPDALAAELSETAVWKKITKTGAVMLLGG